MTVSADFWWDARKKTMTHAQLEQLTWNEFKEMVYEKYIPRSYRKAKEVEFYNLKQGKMSVTEYDINFCDMSRYAPDQTDTELLSHLRISIYLIWGIPRHITKSSIILSHQHLAFLKAIEPNLLSLAITSRDVLLIHHLFELILSQLLQLRRSHGLLSRIPPKVSGASQSERHAVHAFHG